MDQEELEYKLTRFRSIINQAALEAVVKSNEIQVIIRDLKAEDYRIVMKVGVDARQERPESEKLKKLLHEMRTCPQCRQADMAIRFYPASEENNKESIQAEKVVFTCLRCHYAEVEIDEKPTNE